MDKTKQHQAYLDYIHNTYIAKNSDYGDSFSESMDEYGLTAGLIRMGDKMSRLKSLNKRETMSVHDESLQDTLLDLANYAIMTAMWLNPEDEDRIRFFEGDDEEPDSIDVKDEVADLSWNQRMLNVRNGYPNPTKNPTKS